jgi:ribonuclease HIII
MSQITKTIDVGKMFLQNVVDFVENDGGSKIADKNPYMFAKYKFRDCTLSIYTSGKVVLQGMSEIENVEKHLLNNVGGDKVVKKQKTAGNSNTSESSNTENFSVDRFSQKNKSQINNGKILFENDYYIPGMVGADEAGKGEYFGPMVTAACFVPEDIVSELIAAGIRDSKKLSNQKVIQLSKLIQAKTYYSICTLSNREFNQLIVKYNNVSEVLAIAHSTSLHDLLEDLKLKKVEFTKILIDKFTKIEDRIRDKFERSVPIIMEEKGERYLSVACASIIARAKYLEELDRIESQFGKLPKGYSSELAIFVGEFIQNYGEEDWKEIAKVSYRVAGL